MNRSAHVIARGAGADRANEEYDGSSGAVNVSDEGESKVRPTMGFGRSRGL